MTAGLIPGDTLWVAKYDVRNSGETISVHSTKAGALDWLTDEGEDDIRAALNADSYWADREDDPKRELTITQTILGD